MKFKIDGRIVDVVADEHGSWVHPIVIDAWDGYRCENSRDDATGANVFLLFSPDDGGTPESVGELPYERALAWIMENSVEIRETALSAIVKYVQKTLIEDYGLDDAELERITSPQMLINEIDPTFVHLFPYSKDGLPYFSLEFECNWDPEHGCGVIFHGGEALEVGGSETAQGAFDIVDHGGKI